MMGEMLKNKERLAWVVVVIVLVLVNGWFGVNYPLPGPPAEDDIVALGVTHFSGMEVSGDETDALVVNQTGTGDILELRDAGSVVYRVADGGAVTQTGASTVTGNAVINGNATITGTLTYGANSLNPVGYASSGQQLVYGTDTITGTATASHGLTTVTFAVCTLGEDPTAGAGDAAMCTVAVSGNVVTLKAWQDDFVTAATETDVDVHWLVVGAP